MLAACYIGAMKRRALVVLAFVVVPAAALVTACNRPAGGASGADVFAGACARCHGRRGVPPANMAAQLGVPDLTAPAVQRLSDIELRERIERGSPSKGMPAFAGALSDAELAAIIAHLRALAAP